MDSDQFSLMSEAGSLQEDGIALDHGKKSKGIGRGFKKMLSRGADNFRLRRRTSIDESEHSGILEGNLADFYLL